MSETEPVPPSPPPSSPFPQDEDEIRAAVLEFHSKECCFDKRPIKYMTISTITPMSAYRYVLETFVETRVIGTKSVPFRGQKVPPPKACPEKWSVKVPAPPAPPATAVVEFNETANVIPCPTCGATGRVICLKCGGRGTVRCFRCSGRGRNDVTVREGHGKDSKSYTKTERCFRCSGTGRETCTICNRMGWLICPQCEGATRVVLWNILTTTWTLDIKTHNTSRGDLSHQLLDKCQYSGTEVSQQSTPEDIKPLKFPAEPEITQKAKYFVKGMMAETDWRVIALRQAVVVIPVVKVDFQWKKVTGCFYVYGADKQSHFPVKYPGCCCGCMCCCGNSSCSIV